MYGRPIAVGTGAGTVGGLAATGAGPLVYIVVIGVLLILSGLLTLRAGRSRPHRQQG